MFVQFFCRETFTMEGFNATAWFLQDWRFVFVASEKWLFLKHFFKKGN